ncbi:hypothetical protein V865_005373 [Kwoniella europaea PYCC6329]|uniref:BTB domain-containing protein n=1 Tax=Kwoniella europaea PYCC6329 TaxID=1423913 RepID=A0AAX4KLH5_9TREE
MVTIRNFTGTLKLPRTLHPKYNTETDFALISCDLVQFNVDRETILKRSLVLRQIVSDVEGREQASKGIIFLNNGHSDILELFVRLCYGGTLETPEPRYAWRFCEDHYSLALLLRALKASQLYFKLIQQIYKWIMDKQLGAWYFFSFADKANLPDIATCAIAHGQAFIWPEGDRYSEVTEDGLTHNPFWGSIGSVNIMDPTAMAIQSFSSLSDKYIYGICRAMRSSPRLSPYKAKNRRDPTCWNSVASDFQEITRNFEYNDRIDIEKSRPTESYTQKYLSKLNYHFDDSDLTIITSDGVKFDTHRDTLNHTSSTFKDVLAFPQVQVQSATELELTDTEIETSRTVKLFLAFLYNPFEIKSPAPEEFREFIDLIRFCLKYDASDVLDNIRTYLYLWNSIGSLSFADVFLAASYMDDLPLMVAAFSNPNDIWGGGIVRTNHTARNTSFGMIEGAPMFDLSAAPFEWFVQIPMDIRWSLLRGIRRRLYRPLDDQSCLSLGTEFESCVKRIRQKFPTRCDAADHCLSYKIGAYSYRSGSFKNENGSKEKS